MPRIWGSIPTQFELVLLTV